MRKINSISGSRSILLLVLCFFGSVCTQSKANSEILWLKLTTHYIYQDVSIICQPIAYDSIFYFGSEIDESNKVLRGLLIRNPNAPYAKYSAKIDLNRNELAGVTIHQAKTGQRWLEKLRLSRRLTSWILTNTGDNYCPPETLKTVRPFPQYEFDLEDLDGDFPNSSTEYVSFKGLRKDDRPYKTTMKLSQRQYPISSIRPDPNLIR